MVRRILSRLVLALLLWLPAVAVAQNFAVSDTVTEYPHHGTYYHDKFEGRKTSSGEVFDQNGFTAAHWKIKLGTMVMVTNRNTGKQVIVKVNDRCPKRGVFDLSHRSALAIGILGCQPVTVRILPAGYEKRWAEQDAQFDSVRSRLHPTAPPAPNYKTSVAKKTVKSEPKIVAKKTPQPEEKKPVEKTVECYNIELGTAATHADAYEQIQHLPEIYREKVSIDTDEASGVLVLTLELKLSRRSVKELGEALRHKFPNNRLVACE